MYLHNIVFEGSYIYLYGSCIRIPNTIYASGRVYNIMLFLPFADYSKNAYTACRHHSLNTDDIVCCSRSRIIIISRYSYFTSKFRQDVWRAGSGFLSATAGGESKDARPRVCTIGPLQKVGLFTTQTQLIDWRGNG